MSGLMGPLAHAKTIYVFGKLIAEKDDSGTWVFRFGKYAGTNVADTPESYLSWVLGHDDLGPWLDDLIRMALAKQTGAPMVEVPADRLVLYLYRTRVPDEYLGDSDSWVVGVDQDGWIVVQSRDTGEQVYHEGSGCAC